MMKSVFYFGYLYLVTCLNIHHHNEQQSLQNSDVGSVCGRTAENTNLTLVAPTGYVFNEVVFASYGTPQVNSQSCGFSVGKCHAATSQSVVSNLCLGQSRCDIPANNGAFGDPCFGVAKRLAVQLNTVLAWWTNPTYQTLAQKYAPTVQFAYAEHSFPCSMDYILQCADLGSKQGIKKSKPINAQDLRDYPTTEYWLDISETCAKGEQANNIVTAPIYYSIHYNSTLKITSIWYWMLYASQPGQGFKFPSILTCGYDGSVLLRDYGHHQGDVETLVVSLDDKFNFLQAHFFQHGDAEKKDVCQIQFESQTHPIIAAAAFGHASYPLNAKNDANNHVFINSKTEVGVDIGDYYANYWPGQPDRKQQGATWRPWKNSAAIIPIGLINKRSVNANIWAEFQGDLGRSRYNTITAGYTLQNEGVPGCEWAAIKSEMHLIDVGALITVGGADVFGQETPKFVESLAIGNGPDGFGSRPITIDPYYPLPALSTQVPNQGPICAQVEEGQTLNISVTPGYGYTLSSVMFASYGTPTGDCQSGYTINPNCHSSKSMDFVKKACVGSLSCAILNVGNSYFGDPCVNIKKRLYVLLYQQAECPK